MFDNPAFEKLGVRHVRYILPWNVMKSSEQRLRARAFVKRAHEDKISVLLHFSTDDYRIKKGHLPSVSEYKSQVRRAVPYFRKLGVREFGAWNEANHASQPTYRSPTRAAEFYVELYRAVKGRCSSCAVVALDLLDQKGVEKYMRSFYGKLSSTYRRRATVVGLHNYGDVNRKRSTYTRSMIAQAQKYNSRTKFWLTETGGIVKFGDSFPYSPNRAKSRLSTMFSLANTYRRRGIDRIYIYQWTGAERSDRFDAGLIGPDGTPRPGYDYVLQKIKGYLR